MLTEQGVAVQSATRGPWAELPEPVYTPITGTNGNDTLIGTSAREEIQGLGGDDYLDGAGGFDQVLGGDGNDTLVGSMGTANFGGAGTDTGVLAGVPGDYRIVLAVDHPSPFATEYGSLSFHSGADRTFFVGVELFTFTHGGTLRFDDVARLADLEVLGSRYDDLLVGGDHDDLIQGMEGSDTISGGAGNDTMYGDPRFGDFPADVDVVNYQTAPGPVLVTMGGSVPGEATGAAGHDELHGFEAVVGSAFDDVLTAGPATRWMAGGDGNDTLYGAGSLAAAAYGDVRAHYVVDHAGEITTVRDFFGGYGESGTDRLVGVERIQFADIDLAFDLDGARPDDAGDVARLIGVVFGPWAVQSALLVGLGIKFIDGGGSIADLAALALTFRLGPHASHEEAVNLMYSNLTGAAPTTEEAAPYVALLDEGLQPASLAIYAMSSTLNANNIGLAHLELVGLPFTPMGQ